MTLQNKMLERNRIVYPSMEENYLQQAVNSQVYSSLIDFRIRHTF
jgi:hypothetical protein